MSAGALLLGTAAAFATHAQQADPTDPKACVSIETDSARLACYDKALGRDHLPSVQEVQEAQQPPPNLFSHDSNRPVAATGDRHNGTPPVSLLDSRWELSSDTKLGTYNIRGYKPVYILPVFYTNNVNDYPSSPSPDHTVTTSLGSERMESKFQLSFKTKVVQGLINGYGDIWFGYTQSSRWQLYNSRDSRPFRETNYEPEMMAVFPTHYRLWGWDARLMGIGVDHQSNGRSNPLSRSWNRIIASFGFERPGWTVMIRPWWRIPERPENDDNPDIQDYMGRAEMRIVHEANANEYSLMLRHSLRPGRHSHGAAKLTWAFPIRNKLRGYVEVFNGYGESMIDYNHRATYVGIGVSLLGWY